MAKQSGACTGRKRALAPELAVELAARAAAAGIPKPQLAREYGLRRETVYHYLRRSGRSAV